MIDTPGWVYTLHFDAPLGDPARPRMSARHYTGWAPLGGLLSRLLDHKRGGAHSACITRAAAMRGIGWHVAALEHGTPARERQLKQCGAARRCPTCRREAAAR